jgi:hypothetical protein
MFIKMSIVFNKKVYRDFYDDANGLFAKEFFAVFAILIFMILIFRQAICILYKCNAGHDGYSCISYNNLIRDIRRDF